MAEKTFNQRLMDAMAEMVNPKKSKTATVPTKSGKEYNYNYETLDEVLAIVRPALINNQMMLTQGMKWSAEVEGFVLETGVFDAKERLILDTRRVPLCDDAQAQGSWETYLRRYALRTAFGLTGEDDDGAATISANKSSYKEKPASDKQVGMMMGLVDELAVMRSQTAQTVREALSKVIGTDIPDMTSKQASGAIEQLIAWKDKAKQKEPVELAEEDIDF